MRPILHVISDSSSESNKNSKFKNFVPTLLDDFCNIWLISFWFGSRWSKIEIFNPKDCQIWKSLTLTTKMSKFYPKSNFNSKFCWFLDPLDSAQFWWFWDGRTIGIDFKILKNPKCKEFEILRFSRNSNFEENKFWLDPKSWSKWSATVVYRITLRFHRGGIFESQNFRKIGQNIGEQSVTNFFQNFEVDTKIPKSPKLKSSNRQNFEENSLKPALFQEGLGSTHPSTPEYTMSVDVKIPETRSIVPPTVRNDRIWTKISEITVSSTKILALKTRIVGARHGKWARVFASRLPSEALEIT